MRIRYLHTEGFRLSAIYALAFTLCVLAMGSGVLFITGKALRDQILQSAHTDIGAIQHGYDAEGTDEAREVVGQLMGAPSASDFLLLQENGKRLSGNLPAMAPQEGAIELRVGTGGKKVLGVGGFIAPDLYAFSGSGLSRVQETQAQILHTLLWLFAGSLVLAAASGTWVSRSFLHRTDAMARACRNIMDGDLKARLPVRGTHDELDRLAIAVNEMLDRIATLMANIGQVTNDIAHDLRTPVTHLRQRLERAKTECAIPADYDRALDAALEKTDEILALFAALLRIVQIEGGSRRAAFTKLELAPLLQQVRDMLAPVAEAAGHILTLEAEQDAAVRGDRALLVQLFSNLVENAILHTPPGTHIRMRIAQKSGQIAVAVHDNGLGVPQDEHGKLFQPLYRRETSRGQPGHGLGLALVAAVAELHGAKARIEPDETGFCVRILFQPAP